METDSNVQDEDDLKAQVKRLETQETKTLFTQGIKVSPIQFQIPDPKPTKEVIVSLISGAVNIPQRILLGTERGELASTQDEMNWYSRVDERRKQISEPKIYRTFIKLMQDADVLTEGEFDVAWDELIESSPSEQASYAQQIATAIGAWVQAGGDAAMPRKEFWIKILKLPYNEAEIDRLVREAERKEEESMKRAEEQAQADRDARGSNANTNATQSGV